MESGLGNRSVGNKELFAHQQRVTLSTDRFLSKYKNITNNKIYNLSNKVLTPLQELVLGLGTSAAQDNPRNPHATHDGLDRRTPP